MKNIKKIVIGFAESLAAIETAFDLLEAGYEIIAFTRAGSRPPLGKCRSIKICEIPAPEHSVSASEEAICNVIKMEMADIVMPLDDASLWLCDRIRDAITIPIAGPDAEGAALALDKRLQVKEARQAGFNVPATKIAETAEDLLSVKDFPVIIKPALAADFRDGRLGRGHAMMAMQPSDLRKYIETWQGNGPVMVQEILQGTGEGIFGYFHDGSGHAWSSHRRLRMMNPGGSGSSACYSIPVDKASRKATEKFLTSVKWKGIFMIELLKDQEGKQWFIEINGRTWGSMALALRQGFHYPRWAVEPVTIPAISPGMKEGQKEITARHLGRELVHLLFVLRGPKIKGIIEWPARLSTIKNIFTVKKNDRFYNYRKGFLNIFLKDTAQTVLKQLF